MDSRSGLCLSPAKGTQREWHRVRKEQEPAATSEKRQRKRRCPYSPAALRRDAESAGTARQRAAHPDKDAASLPLTSDIRH
ncbi:hypothetical protein EAO24_30815 [Klebsiella pneumoniae]|nr:hypothetical protein EAO24_30815 [Klebsiella pneumoniae]